MAKEGLLIVISGPSATGKGTVCKALLNKDTQIHYSISATTRQPRPGETDCVNYYFLKPDTFQQMIANDEFLEWAEVYGNFYGTPEKKVLEELSKGKDVILEIDTQGAMKVKNKISKGIFIFLVPPSLEELQKRIHNRGTETKEVIMRRMNCALEEMALIKHYHYVVVNDIVEEAVDKILAIIKAEKCKVERNIELSKL